jgi:D-amino peptidase
MVRSAVAARALGVLVSALVVLGLAQVSPRLLAQTPGFKVLISADMEGVSGVVDWKQTGFDGHDYADARAAMTDEVNAAVGAAYAAGAREVTVVDAHGSGTNLRSADLDRRASLISGRPLPMGMMTGIDHTFDAAMFIGYHASASAADATMGHTYTMVFKRVRLDGQEVGEWGLNAALAGHYGVPVVFASGDKAFVEELHATLPAVETVSTKAAVGQTAATLTHPQVVREQIATGVKKALAHRRDIKPWRLETPVTLEVELATSGAAELAMLVPSMQRRSGRVVSYTAPDVETAYRVSVLLDQLTSR